MKSGALDRLRRVESRQNALVKQLRSGFSTGELTDSGACAIEGVRIVEEAIRSGLRFEALFVAESAQSRAERLLPQIGAQVDTVLLPDSVFDSAVPSDSPQGVAGLVRVKRYSLQDVLRNPRDAMLVATAGIQDPGNLGTIIRSAEAFGATGILIGEKTVSPYNSKVVRGSAGSIFRLPVVDVRLAEATAQPGVRWLATSSHKGKPIGEADLTGPVGFLIGSEGAGIPRELIGRVDALIVIPHEPRVESLNAGIAASIILYEAARQRTNKQAAAETQRHAESDH
jgi:TrmH family RNA methyltransferase